MTTRSATACPECATRKAKRACPALGRHICTVCCATKRQVEIRCPASCPYLSSARSHPAAVIQRRQEKDLRFLLPLVADLSEPQSRLLLFLQTLVLRHADGAIPPLLDEDIAGATSAMAATLETAGKGIIYEHQPTSMPAQRLTLALGRGLEDLLKEAGASRGRLERDAAVALRRLEQGARTAAKALPGDEAPVFLKLVGRLLTPPEQDQAQEVAGDASPATSRLIIPG